MSVMTTCGQRGPAGIVLVLVWNLWAVWPAFGGMDAEGQKSGLVVDAEFLGGNVIVDKIEGDTVFVRQDLRDTVGDWFYWCFRVCGAAGRSLICQFTKGNVIGVRGAAVSLDRGETWAWLGTNTVQGSAFRYVVPAGREEVRFCFGIPYLESSLAAFLRRHETSPALRVETLCRSAKGRAIELVRVGQLSGNPAQKVLLTARHHACESLASYVLEGLLETVLRGNEEDGLWLREQVEFMVVPFMDKDGVEEGDQGKNRKPHDHNRDYVQKIYPSVKALTERVPAWSAEKLRVALDLHCPWIRGSHNEVIYFVGGPESGNWARVTRFARMLEAVQEGPLRYRASDNLPFGQGWNTGDKDQSLKSFAAWAVGLPGVRVASTIEIPYANAVGQEVNPTSARAFGRDLARALRRYLDRD
jgi:hypothetical protein